MGLTALIGLFAAGCASSSLHQGAATDTESPPDSLHADTALDAANSMPQPETAVTGNEEAGAPMDLESTEAAASSEVETQEPEDSDSGSAENESPDQ